MKSSCDQAGRIPNPLWRFVLTESFLVPLFTAAWNVVICELDAYNNSSINVLQNVNFQRTKIHIIAFRMMVLPLQAFAVKFSFESK